MTPEILEMICTESNTYAFQRNTELLQLCPKELEISCGILYRMGIVQISCVRDYWSEGMRYGHIADEMSRNRFEHIARKIHFVDNEGDSTKTPKSWKVDPLIDLVNQRFLSITPEEHQRVDEICIK